MEEVSGGAGDEEMYVIYSGEGDQPIGLEELRDALTKLTGQQVALQDRKGSEEVNPVQQPALSHDTDLNFRLSAERMVGEVSFVDDNILETKKKEEKRQIPSQITIETEYGPITLDTSKLTPGQLEGTEQITVNLLTTDASGDSSKEVTETRGLKLPPGLLGPKSKAAYETDDQGSDFNSVLQQLTDLCSEQNPLPVQENAKVLLKDAEGLEDFMSLKIPEQKQANVIEVDKLENFLKSKFGESAKIQIHPTGVVVQQPPKLKSMMCCAAHSELKNQETRRRMLPIPLHVTTCPECNKDCQNRKNLRLHIQRYHVQDFKHQCQTRARVIPPPPEDIITDIPILVETAENLAELGEKSAPKSYKCSVCDQVFTTQKEYFNHIEVHGRRHLTCSVCGMTYTRLSALRNHVDVVHGGQEQMQCQYCMETCTNEQNWKVHELEHERSDDNVKCLKCDGFIPESKFRLHMATLHGVVYKPKLDCVFCGSRFKTPVLLAAHTNRFHNFEKCSHLCGMCYKAFPSADERDNHTLRSHSSEEMMEAEIEFSWQPRDCYKRQCARCGQMFGSYEKLKRHYDSHADEKNQCVLCGAKYHWIVNLDLHIKREHNINDLVKFGVNTPTMNLVRNDDMSFQLVPKEGRQYASRFDLVDIEPSDDLNPDDKIVVMESVMEPVDRPIPTKSKKIATPRPVSKSLAPKTPKTPKTPQPVNVSTPKSHAHKAKEDQMNRVLDSNGQFDYKKYLPGTNTDAETTKAPRHNDIVLGRPATVINLARVWSRRERGLFYMGNEADKFRRAAATIPKKRVGDKWVEMPLFVDELSGKLVTVEGMAELWRERAQIFLDFLGRGQVISDFLPLYELGQACKTGKPLAQQVEANVQRSETTISMIDSETANKGENPDDEEEGDEDDSEDSEDSEEEELGDGIDSTMYTKKVMVRNADGSLEESAVRPRRRRVPEKDIIPDIVSGIKKAKMDLKARAKRPAGKRNTSKIVLVKGVKGRPPGFNPDRDCPYKRRARLVLTNIRDIIGDAKKIIVQMEADHSPERKHWKKQTARKSITRPYPGSTRSSRQERFQKRSKKDEEEIKRISSRSNRAERRQAKEQISEDQVDGPKRRKKTEEDAPEDKGAKNAPKGEKRAASKTNDNPPAKKSKTTIISPRAATLTSSTEPENKMKRKTPAKDDKTPKKPNDYETTAAEPIKRGRGRPKKQKPAETTEEKTADRNSPDPEMPLLEIEISNEDMATDSPLPSTSSTSDDISRETKRAMEFLPADFDLEEASLNTKRKSIKMILHEDEAAGVKVVGSALSPLKEAQGAAGDAWDVLMGTPTKNDS